MSSYRNLNILININNFVKCKNSINSKQIFFFSNRINILDGAYTFSQRSNAETKTSKDQKEVKYQIKYSIS